MKSPSSILALLGTTALLLGTGCETVVRENIISSVQTGIGVTLAENPKTEMYEAKVGYIRSQFYSVPTGKTVANKKSDPNKPLSERKDMRSNAADVTPDLVSGIRMESDARHLFLGMSVAENFAVGKVAVISPAAVAMYVSQAPDKETARAAADAAGRTSVLLKMKTEFSDAPLKAMDRIKGFLEDLPAAEYPKAQRVAAAMKQVGELTPEWDFPRYSWDPASNTVNIAPPPAPLPNDGWERFMNYRGTLEKSIEEINRVLGMVKANSTLAGLKVQLGATSRAMVPEDAGEAGQQAAKQGQRLRAIDAQFAQHPAVQEALAYFSSLTQ